MEVSFESLSAPVACRATEYRGSDDSAACRCLCSMCMACQSGSHTRTNSSQQQVGAPTSKGMAEGQTWAGHALRALDEVILEALVRTHLPRWQALMVRQHLPPHTSTQIVCRRPWRLLPIPATRCYKVSHVLISWQSSLTGDSDDRARECLCTAAMLSCTTYTATRCID